MKEKTILWSSISIIFSCFLVVGLYYVEYEKKAELPNLKNNTNKVKITHMPEYIEGEFYWKVNQFLNREVLVRYQIPLNPLTKKPKASANSIVFYAPYNGDANRIKNGLVPWHCYFSKKLGLSIFSLTIETNDDVDNTKKYYIYKEAGWHELIFEIKAHLEKEFSLTEKPLIIIGESSGGSLAQQMVVSSPKKIACAAWIGGSRYRPFTCTIDIPILAINTWGCYGCQSSRKMFLNAKEHKIPILYTESFPSFTSERIYEHHAASKFSYELIQTFIRDNLHNQHKNRFHLQGKQLLSEKFWNLWNQIPHDAISQINQKSENQICISSLSPPQMVFLFLSGSSDKTFIKDTLFHLYQQNVFCITLIIPGALQESSQQIELSLKRISSDQTLQKLPLIILGYNLNGSYTLLQDFLRAHPKHKIFFVNCNFDQSQKNNMKSFLINSNQKWLDFIYNIYKTEIRK